MPRNQSAHGNSLDSLLGPKISLLGRKKSLLPLEKFPALQQQGICYKSLEMRHRLVVEASTPRRISKNSLLNSLPQGILGSRSIRPDQGAHRRI
jgi:hypothetical protein